MSAAIGYREGGIGTDGTVGTWGGRGESINEVGLRADSDGVRMFCGGLIGLVSDVGDTEQSASGGDAAAACASCKRRRYLMTI